MKTITLDEEAYSRLKSWKKGTSESFSSVVKRVLPAPGSLGAFLAFVERRATATKPGNASMQAAVESRSTAKSDPWS
jgi:negative regulator of replication initiation